MIDNIKIEMEKCKIIPPTKSRGLLKKEMRKAFKSPYVFCKMDNRFFVSRKIS